MIKHTGIMSDVDVKGGTVTLTSNSGEQTHIFPSAVSSAPVAALK